MAQAGVPFDKRLKRIVRRHDKMANGVVRTVGSDGLIVARPRSYTPRFPLKGILLLVVVGFLFKGFLFAGMGAETYNSRVGLLLQGSTVEKVGAWFLQADPATVYIGETISSVLPQS